MPPLQSPLDGAAVVRATAPRDAVGAHAASFVAVSEQQEHPEGAIASQEPVQPAAEPEAPVAPPTPAAGEPQVEETRAEETTAPQEQPAPQPSGDAPAEPEVQAPEVEPAPAEPDPPAAEAASVDTDPPTAEAASTEPEAPAAEAAPAEPDAPVGPKILGVAEEKPLPVVKKRLQEKPKREPLPWPELRAAVAATRDTLEIAQLKELFRLFPEKLREEVTENVRGFKKGARRPVSQHAAKQLARASHTARRMKKNSHPSGEVGQALGQAMAAEMIASLEPERAAQVILPKRDLLERESRQAQRRARDEEDRQRDEQRRRRRDDARSSRQQTSFGEFSGAKIKGLDELAALFADEDAPAPQAPAVQDAPAAEATEAPAPEAVEAVEAPAPEAVEAPAPEAVEAPAPETPVAEREAPAAAPAPEPDARPDES